MQIYLIPNENDSTIQRYIFIKYFDFLLISCNNITEIRCVFSGSSNHHLHFIFLDSIIKSIVIWLLNLIFCEIDEHLFHWRSSQTKLFDKLQMVLDVAQVLKYEAQRILLHHLDVFDFIQALMYSHLSLQVDFIQYVNVLESQNGDILNYILLDLIILVQVLNWNWITFSIFRFKVAWRSIACESSIDHDCQFVA